MSYSNPSGIRPVKNRVILLPEDVEEVSSGGILLTKSLTEREAMAQVYGRIVAIGPGCEGQRWWHRFLGRGPEFAVGDLVVFGKYSGLVEPGVDGGKYRIVNDRDIVAVKEVS